MLIGTEFGSIVAVDWLLTRAAVEARTSRRLESMVAPREQEMCNSRETEVAGRGD